MYIFSIKHIGKQTNAVAKQISAVFNTASVFKFISFCAFFFKKNPLISLKNEENKEVHEILPVRRNILLR